VRNFRISVLDQKEQEKENGVDESLCPLSCNGRHVVEIEGKTE